VITCPACSKQNQDHYRFCLGCGAELPRGGDAAKAQESTEIADESTSLGGAAEPKVDAPVALPPGKCPECGYVNPPTNRFCASCGFRLEDATFYSDSFTDLPLLERVAQPVAVNPDARLWLTARRRGWSLQRWR